MSDRRGSENDGAILASIGRKRVWMGLSGEAGVLLDDTIRCYDADAVTGVTAAFIRFQQDLLLPRLPSRSAIAVAGLARGDSISIMNTRWFLSRSGLEAMLGEAPLILNDFAAEAWATSGAGVRVEEHFSGAALPPQPSPGCYVVVGITSGLGVAVVHRREDGVLTVLPTEAGHGAFAAVTDELARAAAELIPGRPHIVAEDIVSARGLVALYTLLARRAGTVTGVVQPEEITRSTTSNPIARAACEMLAKAFWAQVGSLVMTFGAWDGVLLTGALGNAIRPFLRQAETQTLFAASSKHHRVLQSVPRVFVTVENAELIGVAEALRHNRLSS